MFNTIVTTNKLLKSCVSISNRNLTKSFLCFNKNVKILKLNDNLTNNLCGSKQIIVQCIHGFQQPCIESENQYIHRVLESLPSYKDTISKNFHSLSNIVDNEMFKKDWRLQSASDIVIGFDSACRFAKISNITLSDACFNNLVDGLMDKCQDLTDDELIKLLCILKVFPGSESPIKKNYHDIWSALDDISVKRINKLSMDKILLITDYFYVLGLSKSTDFTMESIKRICQKVHQLNASQLVQALFYINVYRKKWDMINFEYQLEKHIDKLTSDELATISMGFFKTETSIKGTFLLGNMLNKILEETSTIHEISLSAILKIIRYSQHIPLVDKLKELLDKLVPEIDRLSLLCCMHIALAGTIIHLFHEETLEKISQKFVKNISNVRLKDMERLMFALTLFNYNPQTTPCIFETVLNELSNPVRKNELDKFPRCLASCIHFLGLQKKYPYQLIDKILNKEFVHNTYGNNLRFIGREILFIDASVDIDCPDYRGLRINPKWRQKITKYSVHWIPAQNQTFKLSAADKLMLSVMETAQEICGGNEFVHVDHVLPHFQRADIILCRDKNNKPMKVNYFQQYSLGDIMKPDIRNDLRWYAIVVGGCNMFIRHTIKPVGTLHTKLRQLKQIGYIPVLVPWCDFLHLSPQEKKNFIMDKIK